MKTKKCKNCNEEFEIDRNNRRNVFCCHKCAAEYNNKHRGPMSDNQKEKISISLKNVWKEHPELFPHGENHSQKIGMYTKNKYKKEINSILDVSARTTAKIIKRMNLGCSICDWKDGTCDIHHIYGKKINNHNSHSNLTYVCPNHHRMIHENKIDKSTLITLENFLPPNWRDYYYG
jgi:hypothetical protein